MTTDKDPRVVDLEVEVTGTPEQVWDAIATGPGISAWLQPTKVDEREGGMFAFDMGFGMNDSGTMTAWDPPHRFATGGVQWHAEGTPAASLATEWRVETVSGSTCVVRMVMSGFGSGAAWDREIQELTEGMRKALENLRLYCARRPPRAARRAPQRLSPGGQLAWTRRIGGTETLPEHGRAPSRPEGTTPPTPNIRRDQGAPMRKLYSSTFMSLDGVMESPDQWHFAYYSEEMGQELRSQLESAGAMLLGRVTYEEFASYWPHQPSDAPFAEVNNNIRKYVVSTTLDKAEWNNTTLINQNIPEAIRELKQRPGADLHITGSATLVQSLLEEGLLDELRIQLSPVIVGSGKRLFRDGTASMGLTLVESKTLPHGVLALVYRPAAK